MSEGVPKRCLDIKHQRTVEVMPDLSVQRPERHCDATERACLIGEAES